jgi:hypothetical protein
MPNKVRVADSTQQGRRNSIEDLTGTHRCVEAWTIEDVVAWLRSQGLLQVAEQAAEHAIDGLTLSKLDRQGWQEMGVQSAIQRAKLIAAVERESRAETYTTARSTESQEASVRPHATQAQVQKRGDTVTAKHGGAAEHMSYWHAGVATANASGANAKRHVLGFLGMYNVLSLLVNTIGFTMLATLKLPEPGRTDADAWFEVFLFAMYGLCSIMSFVGINATAIAYNVSSACSDANATLLFKMPGMCAYLKQCNDMCLFGCMPLLLCTLALLVKNGVLPFVTAVQDSSLTAVQVFAFVLSLLVIFGGLYMGIPNAAATPMTCAVMFGGLMQDQVVCPDEWRKAGRDPKLWALKATPEEVESFVFGRALERLNVKEERAMIERLYGEYGRAAIDFWHRNYEGQQGAMGMNSQPVARPPGFLAAALGPLG